MELRSGTRDLIVNTIIALVMSVLLSFGAVYGINRYLGPIDDPQITNSLRHPLAD